MTEFEDALLERYERFTSALCLAAQYGVSPRHEQTYAEVREWTIANREFLSSLLDRAGIAASFDNLLAPMTLQDLLRSDEGDLIANVGRISEALYAIAT